MGNQFSKANLDSPYALSGTALGSWSEQRATNRTNHRKSARFQMHHADSETKGSKKRLPGNSKSSLTKAKGFRLSSSNMIQRRLLTSCAIRLLTAGAQIHSDWLVTPETARLLQHWRHHLDSQNPAFFPAGRSCRNRHLVDEVAPNIRARAKFLDHLANASDDANRN
ncbi:MAG: hypothetical protein U0X75_17940 [Acidobacteriota bacterium]